MSENASILLGDYFNNFVNKQVNSGKFTSVSEVIRAALRMFEHQESKKTALLKELKKGEDGGFVENFDREELLKSLHQRYLKENEL